MRKQLITWFAVIAIIVAVLQYTPLRFLSKDVADFAGGVAVGLSIGTLFTWIATGRDDT